MCVIDGYILSDVKMIKLAHIVCSFLPLLITTKEEF